MMQVERLAGLGDHAARRIVAALAFLTLVETDGGAFGVAGGGVVK